MKKLVLLSGAVALLVGCGSSEDDLAGASAPVHDASAVIDGTVGDASPIDAVATDATTSSDTTVYDAQDSATDATENDSSQDAGVDAQDGSQVDPDAEPDAELDASADVSTDVTNDVAAPEAGHDAAPDVKADATDAAAACPSSGTPMVRIKAADGTSFCIDTLETTREQVCSRARSCMQLSSCGYEIQQSDIYNNWQKPDCGLKDYELNQPAAVTFDEAKKVCAFYGKRLCGKVGGGGDMPYVSDSETPITNSEWMEACTNGSTTTFPYGASFDKNRCNYGGSAPVGTYDPQCHGIGEGFSQVFDMLGSYAEWVNACDSSRKDCLLLGGDTHTNVAYRQRGCSTRTSADRLMPNQTFTMTGVRCCAD